MTESMYKHQSRIEKATPIQKANSKLQRKINNLKDISNKLRKSNLKRKNQARKDFKKIKELEKSLEGIGKKLFISRLPKEVIKGLSSALNDVKFGRYIVLVNDEKEKPKNA